MIDIEVISQRWEDGTEVHTARYVDLPRCTAVADTREEAIAELKRIREPYIRFLREEKLPVPASSEAVPLRPAFRESVGVGEEWLSGVVGLQVNPTGATAFQHAFVECMFTHRGVPLTRSPATINLQQLLAYGETGKAI